MSVLLKVEGLTVAYESNGKRLLAVNDANLEILQGEIFGLAGESACGKTTLASSILRLIKPPGRILKGRVVFDGVDLLSLDEEEFRKIRWEKIAYIPQASMNALNPVMRIYDQILDVVKAHRKDFSEDEIRKRAEEIFASVGLAPDVLKMYPHELSGGMRQRVIIAMSLILNPKLLIADEPTTALDVVVQRGIIQLLKEINMKFGTTVLLITHDMAVHAQIVDRLAIMYAGKIVEIGPVKEMFEKPLHPYTQLLIASIPRAGEKRKLAGIPGLPPDLRNPPPGCMFHPRCPFMIQGKCDRVEPVLQQVAINRKVACHLYKG
ncbi:ABC transporter ATP-binding protein [Thermofilum sp.]|uniref:ABC transporter ATP-binding protein n=1 Tax=Thermofilum sp. TaxID=1961369 RepID=UPI002582C724|nr:ABC transporter ATP-binding protein [Thermofilum sp.]